MIAAAFLLLSGVASLSYQVVWVRLLGLSMGSTSASISTVLAAFFLGLALGSYLAERITRNRIDSLKVYIILELIIGLAGLALLPVLLNLDYLMAMMPQWGSLLSVKFAVAIALLIIPTVCMGATFPVMASILIRRQHEVGVRVGQLYSLNTGGAVLGAALSGFLFVPNLGLDGAVYIAVAINMLIVALGIYLNQRIKLEPIEHGVSAAVVNGETGTANDLHEQAPVRGRALIVLFATGFVAIATEVGWTKYLAIFTGTTIYGFAAILTIFLLGIAAGSWYVKSHIDRIKDPALWMAMGLVALGASLLLTRAALSAIPPIYESLNHLPADPGVRHGVRYLFVFFMLFIPTFIFGALFPLNLRLYCGNLRGVRARIGKAYAVNTLASIFGSIAAGFWIIPQYGTDVLLTAMAFIILLLPLMFWSAIQTPVMRTAVAGVTMVAVLSNWVFPHISYKALISSVQYRFDEQARQGKEPQFHYLKEGKAGVISMVSYNGRHVRLQNNGLNESLLDLEDENNVLAAETLLALVPYVLHEDPRQAFVVGFGGGVTTGAFTKTEGLETIKVVELEPEVVAAGRAIRTDGEIPALRDPRVELEFNDARNTLLLNDIKYDVVAAQPSHPWLARASGVFTQEFFTIIRSRLNEGGIYAQWVNLFNMDVTTLKSLFNAFYGVFPEGMVFANIDTGDLMMYGSDQALIFNYERIRKRLEEPRVKVAMNHLGIHNPQDIFWYFSLSRDQALASAQGVPANSDTNILSEVRLSALDGNPKGEENPYDFLYKHYNLNIVSHLGDNKAQKLVNLAHTYIGWNEADLVKHVADLLEPLDALQARSLRYERQLMLGEYQEALVFYDEHQQWTDRVHIKHAGLLQEMTQAKAMLALADRAKNRAAKVEIKARAYYANKQWEALKKLPAVNDQVAKWRLLGLARSDFKSAARQMLALLDKGVYMEIPQIELLLQHYGKVGNETKVQTVARDLVKAVDNQIEQWDRVAKHAMDKEEVDLAVRFIEKIRTANEDADGLKALERRLTKLKNSNGKAEDVAVASR